MQKYLPLHKKGSFPLRIFSVNMTKSASKQLFLYSHYFGNSNSCVQKMSRDKPFDPSYHKVGKQLFWIGGKHFCFTPKRQNPKEIEVDMSMS